MARRPERGGSRRFFVVFALVVAGLVVAGFTNTFFVPVARGTFSRPPLVYVHGSFFFLWALLLIAQAALAASHRIALHRSLGWIAAGLVPAMVLSGVGVAAWATARDLRAGRGDGAVSFFFGQLMDMALFATLASVAFVRRRQPDVHKRLILLATLAILGAAVGRIPVIGRADALVTLGLLLSIVAYDIASRGRLHPATLWGGLAFLAGQLVQGPAGATDVWLTTGRRIVESLRY